MKKHPLEDWFIKELWPEGNPIFFLNKFIKQFSRPLWNQIVIVLCSECRSFFFKHPSRKDII